MDNDSTLLNRDFFFFLLTVAKCIVGKNKAKRNCSKMGHDGPLRWGGGVDLTLRLSHFASFEVSYRIIFCFRAGVVEGCGLGPHSGLRFKTSCQYSCLGHPMEGGAWWAAVHGVTKSRTR